MAITMNTQDRIGSWIAHTEPVNFIKHVNADLTKEADDYHVYLKDGTVNERVITRAYNKIHDYVFSNLKFLNRCDSQLILTLSERVREVGKITKIKDSHEEELFNIAKNLSNLNPQRYSFEPNELTTCLNSDIEDLIGKIISLQEAVEVLACRSSLEDNIIEKKFHLPNLVELNEFLVNCCQPLIKIQNSATFRAVGCCVESEGVRLANHDAVSAYIRTFCALVERSPKKDEWLSAALESLNSYVNKKNDDRTKAACQKIIDEINNCRKKLEAPIPVTVTYNSKLTQRR